MSTTATPAAEANPAPAPASPADTIAGVFAGVQAINAQISDPAITATITGALQRLTVVQALATAVQDGVNDLRAHTTVQLAAVGAAANKLVDTGDVEQWKKTVTALQLATHQSQQRLEALIALAQRGSPAGTS